MPKANRNVHPRPMGPLLLVMALFGCSDSDQTGAHDRDRQPAPTPEQLERPVDVGTRALLIGVSDYPTLKENLEAAGKVQRYRDEIQLAGPPNDIALMTSVLEEEFGFQSEEIGVLVSGGQVAPTLENILAALDVLAEGASDGELVVIYFAGHGTRVPDDDGDEDDSWDELLLTEDTAGWESEHGNLRGGLRDDVIQEKIEAIRASGRRVWLIVDACHSGGVLRTANRTGVRTRYLAPSLLGIPGTSMDTPHRRVADPVIRRSGGVVAMTAVPSYQAAKEWPMGPHGQSHGLFSYSLAKQLTLATPDVTFQELYQSLCSQYVAHGHKGLLPTIEGDVQRVIRSGLHGAHRLVAMRMGQEWRLDAGALHGIEEGFEYAVFEEGRRLESDAIRGWVRVRNVALHTSKLQVLTERDEVLRPRGSTERLPVELMRSEPRRFLLPVSFQRSGEGLEAGDVLPILGQDESWLLTDEKREAELADILARLVEPSEAAWIVEVLPADRFHLFESGTGTPVATSVSSDQLATRVRELFQATNLIRVANRADAGLPAGFQVDLEVELAPGTWQSVRTVPLRPGQSVRLVLENETGQDWDVTVFIISPTSGIQRLFPDGRSATVTREEKIIVNEPWTQTDKVLGLHHLFAAVLPSGSPTLDIGGSRAGQAGLESVPIDGIGKFLHELLPANERGSYYDSREIDRGGVDLIPYQLEWGTLTFPPGGTSIEVAPSAFDDPLAPAWAEETEDPLSWSGTALWYETHPVVRCLAWERGDTQALLVDIDGDSEVGLETRLDFELAIVDRPQGIATFTHRSGPGWSVVTQDQNRDGWIDSCWIRGEQSWVEHDATRCSALSVTFTQVWHDRSPLDFVYHLHGFFALPGVD